MSEQVVIELVSFDGLRAFRHSVEIVPDLLCLRLDRDREEGLA